MRTNTSMRIGIDRHAPARAAASRGGNSPVIVFDDADLEKAVPTTLAGIFSSSRQSCVAGSRLLLQRDIHDEFMGRLRAAVTALQVGPPERAETAMGPLSTLTQHASVLRATLIKPRQRVQAAR